MTDQLQMEVINDASETESEEWDLIQHKDIQISGNTSDAESVEIINEEEVVETSALEEPISSDNNGEEFIIKKECHNEEKLEETNVSQLAEIDSTSDAEFVQRDFLHGYLSQADRLVSAPKDAVYICLAVLVVGFAMLIIPEDGRIKSTSPASVLSEKEIDVASLISELRTYRDSNENLKLQVMRLTEVVNGWKKVGQGFSVDEVIKTQTGEQFRPLKADLLSPEKPDIYNNYAFNGLIELINIYKAFSYLPNNTKVDNGNNTIDYGINGKFNYSTLFKDIFGHMYNESIQNTLDLFYNIPTHLKELTTKALDHENVQPFISKWGHKLSKFSHSLQNDIRKMKIKFAKHTIKSVNSIMYSFYKKLCNFEINKVITFQECASFNFTKDKKNKKTTNWETGQKSDNNGHSSDNHWKKEERKYYKENGKRRYKINGNKEKNYRIHNNDQLKSKIIDESSEEILSDDNFNTHEENIRAKILENTAKKKEEIAAKFKKQINQEFHKKNVNFDENLESKITSDGIFKKFENNNKNDNSDEKKYSEIPKKRENDKFIMESCEKSGFSIKCNETQKSIKTDENWFLNIGNQRSKIRSYQSKIDWLFDRARARREKNLHDNQNRFYQKHGTAPPPFSRRHRYHWYTDAFEIDF